MHAVPYRIHGGMFANDTSLYVTVNEDVVTATNQLNDDLNQITTWAETWLVKFNANKRMALTVTLKRNLANLELPLYITILH